MTGRRTRDRVKRDCTHNGRHQHGTQRAYSYDKCGCLLCSAAHANAMRVHRSGGQWVEAWVDATTPKLQLRALTAAGVTAARVAAHMGVTGAMVSFLRRGVKPRMTHKNADLIQAAYDALWDKGGTDSGSRKAATYARKQGWLLPLELEALLQGDADIAETYALDEVLVDRYIDGTAPPVPHGRRAPAERREAIRRLAAKGWDDGRISRRVGMNRDAVLKERTRHGIPAGTPREAA